MKFFKRLTLNETFLETFVTVVSVFGQLLFFVQAYHIYELRSAASVSFPAFFISFISLSVWFMYGCIKKITPLIIANAVGIIGALLVLTAICVYGS